MSVIYTHKIKHHNLLAEFWCKYMCHYTLSVKIEWNHRQTKTEFS